MRGRHHAFGGQSPPPIITLVSGSGYAGSVLQSSAAGQWTADGVAIIGATGTSYTITAATEGKDIKCANSNTFLARWLPSQLAGLVAWFDANSGITLNGSNVSAWASRVGSIVANQSTAANQPVYNATGLNGKPCIKYALSFRYLKAVQSLILPSGAGASTFIWCGQIPTTNYSPVIFLGDRGLGRVINIGSLRTGNDQDTSVTPSVSGNVILWTLDAGANPLSKIFIDGTLKSTVNRQVFNTPSNADLFIGTNGTNPEYAGQEAVIFNRALNISEVQICEGYQAHKWGLTANLPSDHPYKNSPPMKV